jgi:hypothetical protein
MMQHLVVEVDSTGTSVVYVPLFHLGDLLRFLPAGLANISYHYQSNQAQVSFPGLRPSTAQQIVDAALTKDCDSSSSDPGLDKGDPDRSVPS